MTRRFDAVVVGAGPSGSSAARKLAEKGFKTLLIEKRRLPRPKPCAGILPPRIRKLIHIPSHLVERNIDGYRLFPPSGEPVVSRFPLEPGFAVERASFDHWLVGEALRQGSELLQGTQVTRVRGSGKEMVEVSTTSGSLRSLYVIGADGVWSDVKRSLGLPPPSRDQLASTYQRVFEQEEKVIDSVIGNYFEIYYDPSIVREGYLWIAPYRDHFSIGYGCPLTWTNSSPDRVLAKLKESKKLKPLFKSAELLREEAHPIPYTGPFQPLGKGKILFAGDAGGFVHPFTGEGIYFAIASGYAAAEAIATHPRASDLVYNYEREAEKKRLLRLRDLVEQRHKRLGDDDKIKTYLQGLATLSRRSNA